MRKLLVFGMIVCLAASLVGCSSGGSSTSVSSSSSSSVSESVSSYASTQAAPLVLENRGVIYDDDFGGVYVDMTVDEFNAYGFEFGDSLDVVFSNGFSLSELPYYSGYFVGRGEPLVVGYPDYPYVKICVNYGESLWETAGVSEGDTVTITLAERGKYKTMQDIHYATYTDERSDYASDEVFANFRAMKGGSLKEGTIYRSATPDANIRGRASYASALAKDAGVQFVLNFSENDEEVSNSIAEDEANGVDVSYYAQLYESGNVDALDMDANYGSSEFKSKLASGLNEFAQHEGPYLIHCTEGKDRTGFACMLLEALSGATYQEMCSDYMKSYDNYYGINEQSNPENYKAIVELHLHDMLRYIADADESTDLTAIDYTEPARKYLRAGGMSNAQIDELIACICQP